VDLLAAVAGVPALEVVAAVDLLDAPAGVAGLGAVVEVVLDALAFEVVPEVLPPAAVFEVPVLAVVAEVFWGVAGVVGVCGESVCPRRIAAETKIQTKIISERFMIHPFGDI
jgi:hypothetical protein